MNALKKMVLREAKRKLPNQKDSCFRKKEDFWKIGFISLSIMNALIKWFFEQLRENFQTKKIAVLAYRRFLENRFHFLEHHERLNKMVLRKAKRKLQIKKIAVLGKRRFLENRFHFLEHHECLNKMVLRKAKRKLPNQKDSCFRKKKIFGKSVSFP